MWSNAAAVAEINGRDDDSDDDIVIGSSQSSVLHSNTVSKSGKTSYSCVICDHQSINQNTFILRDISRVNQMHIMVD